MPPPLSNADVIDTRFRAALQRMAEAGRLKTYDTPVDTHLEVAAIMKKLDGGPALLFTDPKGFATPVLGNFLSAQANCEAAFGVDFRGIRTFVTRALGAPLPPEIVKKAAAQEVVLEKGFDLGKLLPALHHTTEDAGRFITAGIVIVKDPDTGIYNASYHRLQLLGPDRTGLKLDLGRINRIPGPDHIRLGSAVEEELLDGVAGFTKGIQTAELALEIGDAKDLDGPIHGAARKVIDERGH